MLTKRIIPCLDIKDGRTVKGINFINLRDAGDPVEMARQYADQNADEFAFSSNIPQFAEPCLMILNVWEFCLLSLNVPN